MVFIVDGSGSICENDPVRYTENGRGCKNWELVVQFVINFVEALQPSADGSHVGLISFATTAYNLAGLDK
jgi:hypothetical protein